MELTENGIQLIGILINSIIAIAAIGTLIYQRMFNTKTLDYNLHPDFKVSDFCPQCTTFWTPKLCESSDPKSKHYCTDDHWFDITNHSKGPAFEFKCYLIHNKEINDDFKISNYKNRINKREALVYNGTIKYKIPLDTIPFKYYNKVSADALHVIIEYKTINLRSKFRQIINLSLTPERDISQITDWKNAIKISNPEVASLKKIQWWESDEKTLIRELKKIK